MYRVILNGRDPMGDDNSSWEAEAECWIDGVIQVRQQIKEQVEVDIFNDPTFAIDILAELEKQILGHSSEDWQECRVHACAEYNDFSDPESCYEVHVYLINHD